MSIESPDTIHGRMKEGAHIAGYGLTRAMENLKWLLEDERFLQLAPGYRDVNEFLRDTKEAFKLLRINPEERKQIAELVKDLQPDASQRAIADMVGVSDKTIGSDLGAEYSAPPQQNTQENEMIDAEYSAPWTANNGYDPSSEARSAAAKQEREIEREQQREERLAKVPEAPVWEGEYALDNIYLADSTDIKIINSLPKDAVDMIFTDPPWDEGALECYESAGRIANRALKPGAFLAIYCGKMFLPEIYHILTQWLDYVWTYCVFQPDNNWSITRANVGIFEAWRPIALFRKPGDYHNDQRFAPDALKCTRQKGWHEWQQGTEPVEKYMDLLTEPGDVVLDPFVGGGSVPWVAQSMKRHFLAFDRDEETVRIALARMNGHGK